MTFFQKILAFFGLYKAPVIQLPTAQQSPAPAPVQPLVPNPESVPAPAVVQGPWNGETVDGVDTSKYQLDMTLADWKELFARGFRWMYPKGVDGKGPNADIYLLRSKLDAALAGFICFAGYCFFRFDQDPLEQARALFRVTGGVKVGEGPLVIDSEWDNQSKDLGYHDRDHGGTRQMIDGPGEEKLYACLCEVERLSGVTPWLYGSYGFLKFNNPARFARFPFIIANYSKTTADDKVPLPAPWKIARARQYSGTLKAGKVVEIDGDRFLGSLEELKAYVKK